MTVIATFAPSYSKGVTVAPGAASASVNAGLGSKALCLSNLGTSVVYVRATIGASAATVADYPVLAGSQVTISIPQDTDTVSFISPGGAGSLHIIQGEGF